MVVAEEARTLAQAKAKQAEAAAALAEEEAADQPQQTTRAAAPQAATAQTESLLSQPISNMTEKYAILDEQGGWLVNTVLWDGDTAKWQPPTGTSAVRLADIDLSTLPPAPEPEAEPITAEQHLASVGLAGDRQPTLLYLRLNLQAAGKQSPELDQLEAYLSGILSIFAADPSPRNDWPQPPLTFEAAVQSAMSVLNPSVPSV